MLENVKDIYLRYLRLQESGSNTILNILLNIYCREKKKERKKRESGSIYIIDYIVLSLIIIMNTNASIYRKTNNLVD